MNNTQQIGRLVADPELSFLPETGVASCRFTIAVDRSYQKDKNNKVTDFHRIQVWGKLGEVAAQYLSKGSQVGISGEVQNNNYEKDNVKHYGYVIRANEVKFLDSKNKSQQSESQEYPGFVSMDDDNEVPF